ncbi:hypothetical protein FI667_g15430, partial [Globisporangium splendens]
MEVRSGASTRRQRERDLQLGCRRFASYVVLFGGLKLRLWRLWYRRRRRAASLRCRDCGLSAYEGMVDDARVACEKRRVLETHASILERHHVAELGVTKVNASVRRKPQQRLDLRHDALPEQRIHRCGVVKRVGKQRPESGHGDPHVAGRAKRYSCVLLAACDRNMDDRDEHRVIQRRVQPPLFN